MCAFKAVCQLMGGLHDEGGLTVQPIESGRADKMLILFLSFFCCSHDDGKEAFPTVVSVSSVFLSCSHSWAHRLHPH